LIWILCVLLAGLPFEYYFLGPEKSLFTTLKLQWALFLGAWALIRLRSFIDSPPGCWHEVAGRIRASFLLAAAVLAGTQLGSAVFAAEFTGNALRAAIKTVLGVLTMVAVADVIRNARTSAVRYLLAALAVTTVLTAAIGLGSLAGLNFLTSWAGIFQPVTYFTGGQVRLTSTMEYPNTAAVILSAGVFASVALASTHRWWWLLAAAVQGSALILTYSRGAMAAAVAATAVCVMLPGRTSFIRSRLPVLIAGVGILVAGGAQILRIRQGAVGGTPRGPARAALFGFKAADEIKHLAPDRTYRETLGIRNTSSHNWRSRSFGIASRWHSVRSGQTSELALAGDFRHDVPPGGEQALEVEFHTPEQEGEYLLIWFVVRREGTLQALDESYSPAVLCSISAARAARPAFSDRALSYLRHIRRERRALHVELVPSRASLWTAALRMFRQDPVFGAGADNFRLLKWRFMDTPEGDERILANSLYLEFLAGGGITGFTALLWFGAEIIRLLAAAVRRMKDYQVTVFGVAYFTAFFVHGLVDYFLKFTPTFLLFWIAAGLIAGIERPEENHSHAPRV
jgi:hypothetical protein